MCFLLSFILLCDCAHLIVVVVRSGCRHGCIPRSIIAVVFAPSVIVSSATDPPLPPLPRSLPTIGVDAIVKWINHLAELTLEIKILINLWAEALYFAVRGEGEEIKCWRGKSVSFHVTFFCVYLYARLRLGMSVPLDFVSTHPRDEGVGQRDCFFIGMSVGSSVGTKEGVCFWSKREDVVNDIVGFDVGVIIGSSV